MHPTVRVFDNRIIFQNPGKIVVDMNHWREGGHRNEYDVHGGHFLAAKDREFHQEERVGNWGWNHTRNHTHNHTHKEEK